MSAVSTTISCGRTLAIAVAAARALAAALVIAAFPILGAQAPTAGTTELPPPPAQTAPAPAAPLPQEALWSVSLGVPAAAPGFDRARAYVPLRDGRLTAVSLATGKAEWSIELATKHPPAAGDDLVFALSAESVFALDPATGAVRWRRPVGAAFSAPPLWDTGWLIAATQPGELLAIRATDGELLWRAALGSPARAPAAPAAERVYASLADGRVMALDIKTGTLAWERRLGGAGTEILALDDRLFVGSTDNYFYCLSTKDGAVKWRWRTGGDIVGAAVVDESRVYFLSLDNILRALDRGHGAQRWKRPLASRPAAGPQLLHGALIVSGIGSEIRAYGALDGSPAGEFSAASDLAAPPRILTGGGTLEMVVLTGEGQLTGLTHAPPPVPPPKPPRAPLD